LTRPHVEHGFASAVWDPHLKKDVKSVKAIQRPKARFVKGDTEDTEGEIAL